MLSSDRFGSGSILVCVLTAVSCSNAVAEDVVLLSSQTFGRTSDGDWLVLFCDEAVPSCAHMTDSFKKLSVIWSNTGRFVGTNYAEVNCAVEKGLCKNEGVAEMPAVIHFRNHVPIDTWTPNKEEAKTPVWQFVEWSKTELVPSKASPKVDQEASKHDGTSWGLSLFSDMDSDAAAVGHCLVLAMVLLIGWVVLDGFELWPGMLEKVSIWVPESYRWDANRITSPW